MAQKGISREIALAKAIEFIGRNETPAISVRELAKEHKGLYKVTISLPALQGDVLTQTAAAIAESVFLVLSQYKLGEEQSIHWQRILRRMIHGFFSQEEAGFFQHAPVSEKISYQTAIRCFLTGLHAEIGGRP